MNDKDWTELRARWRAMNARKLRDGEECLTWESPKTDQPSIADFIREYEEQTDDTQSKPQDLDASS